MNYKEIKLLIIPDVHGRDFWREPVQETLKHTDSHIVFLGDYLDPYYPSEKFTNDDALKTFKEIIELKKEYPDRITLLQGNHDMGYSISSQINTCRRDYKNSEEIIELFNDNEKLFDIAYEYSIAGKVFLLTHAGVTKEWLEMVQKAYPYVTGNAETLNKFFHDEQSISLLGVVSYARGGYYSTGSIVWASAFSDTAGNTVTDNYIHIVGHTQLNQPVKIADNLYDTDARVASYIDSEGNIKCVDGTEYRDYKILLKNADKTRYN